jgi:DNA polymerase-1
MRLTSLKSAGDEQVALAALGGERDALDLQARALEELGGLALELVRVALRVERQALERGPERRPPGDVDGAGAVDAQPDLVLVLVGRAAAERRRGEEQGHEAAKHGRGILAEARRGWTKHGAPDQNREQMPKPTTVYLVDGSGQFHRAFHAIRGLATSKGLPTNATYGFTTMLRKLVTDEKPAHIAVVFDPPGKTFRHEEFSDYKANRPPMDSALALQLPYIRRVCAALRMPIVEVPGFEADDVIATLVRQALERGIEVVVVSADKDLLQLVQDHVRVLNPGREGSGSTSFDRKLVEEKWGVPPERIVDVLALVGDSVDNIPGVAGIGDKGARDLVREFGPVEAVLENADKVKRAPYREGLKAHRAEALLSKQLVTLRRDVPVELDMPGLAFVGPDNAAAHALFKELEFQVLAREYAPEMPNVTAEHRLATTTADVEQIAKDARAAGRLALGVVVTSEQAMRAHPLGIALSWAPGHSAYVPLGHSAIDLPQAPTRTDAVAALKPLLEDASVPKVSAHAKRDQVVLGRLGVAVAGLGFDTLLASYLLDPGRRAYALEDVAMEHLGERRAPGTDGLAAADAAADPTSRSAGAEAELVLRLEQPMTDRLEAEGLRTIYQSMELPLVAVLADMERAGVKVDTKLLAGMSRDMDAQLQALTIEIYRLAKGEFNIQSPIQLREVLFDRLGMKSAKKTAKTRAASTAEDVLEELALLHDLPRKILEYRSVQKLKSTYVDSLPEMVSPETGRIHATFNQTVAATGRLSATEPNLQNIPIRTAEGPPDPPGLRGGARPPAAVGRLQPDRAARAGAPLGRPDADRHLQKGEDVHDRTSREIFGALSPIPPDEQRRISKMVNYALLYGKSAFTLAKDIGVSRGEAAAFIDAYFARYPKVREFIDDTILRARETGQVRTLLGRLRRLPDLRSKNIPVRMEAERQAMNTPVQGSAADLIKRAMIDLHAALGAQKLRSRLILQIHDELLLEVPEAEAEAAQALVKRVMEGALELVVPLVADARLGRSWADVH